MIFPIRSVICDKVLHHRKFRGQRIVLRELTAILMWLGNLTPFTKRG